MRDLMGGALGYGYATDLWTSRRIAEMIDRRFGVRYHRAHISRLLAQNDWTRALTGAAPEPETRPQWSGATATSAAPSTSSPRCVATLRPAILCAHASAAYHNRAADRPATAKGRSPVSDS